MQSRLLQSIVRPVRFAFLLGANPTNQEVLRVLRFSCEMLGGIHNLIIPTDGVSLQLWWARFLEAGDPDMIVYYGRFQNLDAIKSQVRSLNIQPFESKVIGKSVSFSKLTDLTLSIARIYDLRIAETARPYASRSIGLMHIGRSRQHARLIGHFILGSLSHSFESEYRHRLSFVTPWTFRRLKEAEIITAAEMTRSYMEYDDFSFFSFCYDDSVLGPWVAVTGDQNCLEDCCLFWNWRALSTHEGYVEWILPQAIDGLVSDPKSVFTHSKIGEFPQTAKLLTSCSLGASSSGAMKKILSSIPDVQSKIAHVGFSYKHVSEYDGNLPCLTYFNAKESMPIVADRHVRIGRRLPSPYVFDDCIYKDLISEIRVISAVSQDKRGLRVSPRYAVGDFLDITEAEYEIQRRVSKFGFSIILPSFLSVDTIGVNFMSDWEILSNICEERGVTIAESPAAKHIRRSLELAGGIEELASYYRNDITKCMFDLFLEPHAKEARDLVGQRREIYRRSYTVAGMKRSLYDSLSRYPNRRRARSSVYSQVDDWFHRWLERGILSSGFQLSCPKCDFEGWYPITAVGENYRCWRCQSEVMRPPSAEIHYRLHESVYQAHKDHMIVPILTLDWLRKGAQHSFVYTTPVLLEKGNPKSPEIDVLAMSDGRVIIGECKVPNRMSKSVYGKYGHLADKISADIILFATATRKNTCESVDCKLCRQLATDSYADEIFTHGISANPNQWGDREKIGDFRIRQSQKGITVWSLCTFDLGLRKPVPI
jgi:hypothetical protein